MSDPISVSKTVPERSELRERLVKLVSAKNVFVFLSGLACFILALNGNDHWASGFGTMAVLMLFFW